MNVTTIPLLTSLAWGPLKVLADGVDVTLTNIYPFLSVTDLKRLLWIHFNGDSRWAPERTFIGVRSATGIRPIEFIWSSAGIDLPDPLTHREPNPALVDETGVRKPVNPTMIGSLVLETALSPEIAATGAIPELTAISLDSLIEEGVEVSDAVFGGYYQMYFPWLTDTGKLEVQPNAEAYAAAVPYTEDRTARIGVVEKALRPASVSLDTFVRLRWILPPPLSRPESLENTFYALQASPTIPFLRYFPAKSTQAVAPLLKLAVKADGSPVLSDPKIFAQYLNQPAPNAQSAVIVARSPLNSDYAPAATAFTIHLFEDGTSDVSLDVPQRGVSFIAAVATEAQRILKRLMGEMGFDSGVEASLRDIHATYRWDKQGKALTAARLQSRAATMTPFLDPTTQIQGDTALATFQWRATSNYESESAQHSFLTQIVLRDQGKSQGQGPAALVEALQKRFGITEAAATTVLERWVERKTETVGPTGVQRHSAGASIAVYADYRVEIQGVESSSDLQRILSVVGVLLSGDLAMKPPAPAMQAVTAAVELADAVQEEAVPEEDVFDMGDLLEGLGFGGDDDPEVEADVGPEVEAEVDAAPLPDLDAVDTGNEDCSREPLPPGTIIRLAKDYYMDKLITKDMTMFGYGGGTTHRNKVYSKSCQRQQDRQPNIMTLQEYARIKKCYESKVRFVDLPPRKPSDVPFDPAFDPKRNKYPPEYFLFDPVTKKPMWTVYGYESKSERGTYRYLMCSELWCEHDNMPLLPSEFEAAGSKCPFCGGREIADMKKPRGGETVIARKASKGNIHSFIGIMSDKIKHPSGYSLPCCDSTPRLLKHYMTLAAKGGIVEAKGAVPLEDDGQDEEGAEPPPEVGDRPEFVETSVDYNDKFKTMLTQYILGNDKALEAGKIAILPPALDAFFGQKGTRSLKMQGIRPTFDDNVFLFVRVGVDTHTQADRRGMNLFAGLAPILGMSTPSEVMKLFLGSRIPRQGDIQEPDAVILRRLVRAFEAANYGTLLMEFAAKSTEGEPPQGILEDFAARNGYSLGPSRPHVIRLYRAWTTFLRYIVDPRIPKQLRHFEHLLAQPGPVIPRGQLFIVLEQEGDAIKVVCPSFGIPTAPVFGDVPVSILWHDVREDSWEPIVLYNGTQNAVLNLESVEMKRLPQAMRASISTWIRTWRGGDGCGRPAPPPHAWTPDRDTSGLPRLTGLLPPNVAIRDRFQGVKPAAIVRDRSNRLVGVVYANGCFVPCLDDGGLLEDYGRLYEAEMLPPTSWAVYDEFYKGLAKEFRGLRPVSLLNRDGQIVGFETEMGVKVPVIPEAIAVGMSLPVNQTGPFTWEQDAIILRAPDATGAALISFEESTASQEEQATEAYQYVRLSLSRLTAATPLLRRNIGIIVKSSLPLYEKRKRMDILLEPKVQSLIAEDAGEDSSRSTLSLIRQDCLSLPQASCQGQCSWSEGRCLIHVPSKTPMASIFTARLSDELLRYSRLRNEIMEGTVPTIRTPKGAVRVGNELYMATKPKEMADDIMGRLGFNEVVTSAFPEELVRFEGMDDDVIDIADESVLPPDWGFKGFAAPQVDEGLEDARGFMLAGVTGRSLDDWAALLDKKRGSTKPFNWSADDIQLLSTLMLSNLLFVRAPNKIEAWYAPVLTSTYAKRAAPMYSIFWGSNQLLLSKGAHYKFLLEGLPASLRTALDGASPLPVTTVGPTEIPVPALVEAPVPTVAPAVAPVVEAPAVEAPAGPSTLVDVVSGLFTAMTVDASPPKEESPAVAAPEEAPVEASPEEASPVEASPEEASPEEAPVEAPLEESEAKEETSEEVLEEESFNYNGPPPPLEG